MTVLAEFYKHINLGSPVEMFILDNSWRYLRLSFGNNLGDEISSLRATASAGTNGNVYGFTHRDLLGNYASLNMDDGWTSWWSFVGDSLNDDIESALVVNRSRQGEIVLSLGDLIADEFAAQMDSKLAETRVSRRGDTRVYTLFWPGHDPNKMFVSLEQDLKVAIEWWPDYDAQVRYDVELYLTSDGKLDAYVAWTYVWVEGGIFSGDVFDGLQPELVSGGSALTTTLRSQLASFGRLSFSDLYLLPGPPPSDSFGDIRNAKDGSTLVLIQ